MVSDAELMQIPLHRPSAHLFCGANLWVLVAAEIPRPLRCAFWQPLTLEKNLKRKRRLLGRFSFSGRLH